MDALPFEQWKSLQLIRTKVKFNKNDKNANHWLASFKDGLGNSLELKVTDSTIGDELKKYGENYVNGILTISLAGPWAPPNNSLPERCYKLVAGIVALWQ